MAATATLTIANRDDGFIADFETPPAFPTACGGSRTRAWGVLRLRYLAKGRSLGRSTQR